jgi:hypothetical protein
MDKGQDVLLDARGERGVFTTPVLPASGVRNFLTGDGTDGRRRRLNSCRDALRFTSRLIGLRVGSAPEVEVVDANLAHSLGLLGLDRAGSGRRRKEKHAIPRLPTSRGLNSCREAWKTAPNKPLAPTELDNLVNAAQRQDKVVHGGWC